MKDILKRLELELMIWHWVTFSNFFLPKEGSMYNNDYYNLKHEENFTLRV